MTQSAPTQATSAERNFLYELCYRPLHQIGRGFAFPCDALGKVAMDALSERALANYLYARAVVGNELGWPLVQRRGRPMGPQYVDGSLPASHNAML